PSSVRPDRRWVCAWRVCARIPLPQIHDSPASTAAIPLPFLPPPSVLANTPPHEANPFPTFPCTIPETFESSQAFLWSSSLSVLLLLLRRQQSHNRVRKTLP